uniref:D-amino-acid oxidase n=1 Tax=Lygus hesperus TaxID=30085 RepID=A0A0A9VQY7_LYGHE
MLGFSSNFGSSPKDGSYKPEIFDHDTLLNSSSRSYFHQPQMLKLQWFYHLTHVGIPAQSHPVTVSRFVGLTLLCEMALFFLNDPRLQLGDRAKTHLYILIVSMSHGVEVMF